MRTHHFIINWRIPEHVQNARIASAAGCTGGAIAKALLQAGNFRLSILVRESPINKPAVKELTDAGAEVIVGDISDFSAKLQSYLEGVDVLIWTGFVTVDQRPLPMAAEKAGVGGVVPSDFGPTAPRGVMFTHDPKLEVREYIKELGLHTPSSKLGRGSQGCSSPLCSARNTLTTQKLVYSTLLTIGRMVTHLVVDSRTLNQTVVAYDREISISETWKVAERVIREDFPDYSER